MYLVINELNRDADGSESLAFFLQEYGMNIASEWARRLASNMVDEKRKDYRLPMNVPCLWKWQNRVVEAETVNLSFGGACLNHSSSVPPVGADIEIVLLDGEPFTLKGKVVCTRAMERGTAFGVAFNSTADYNKYCSFFSSNH
jgi:hypothetical protein